LILKIKIRIEKIKQASKDYFFFEAFFVVVFLAAAFFFAAIIETNDLLEFLQVKLKKLHKMGDVRNTILKHFEKEKMIIDQNQIHIFSILIFIFYHLQIIEIIKSTIT
jgi:hypothetical protein